MTTIPIERSFSLQTAEAMLMAELDKLGYQYEFEMAGEVVHTCKCTIIDKKTDDILCAGNGKGEQTASRVGSLFEATEHLFSNYDFIQADKITYLGIKDFCENNTLCDKLPLATLKEVSNIKIPFLAYKAVNSHETCYYPLALSCPSYVDYLLDNNTFTEIQSYPYKRLEQYSSNSGTAIGMNREEAVIHGLLECIERTSLSELLTKIFLLNQKKQLKIIDTLTLPENIHELLQRIEKEQGGRVLTVQMPNQFGIPAYCSWLEQADYQIAFAGYGCSLSSDHAILRSLHELIQYFLLGKHIHGLEWLKNLDKKILAQLEGLPLHQDCAKFNIGIKCDTLGYELLNYQDLPQVSYQEPSEYLKTLTDIIYEKGETPFACELHNVGNGITITHTFITGEDRFFNVKNGKSTFPVSLTTK